MMRDDAAAAAASAAAFYAPPLLVVFEQSGVALRALRAAAICWIFAPFSPESFAAATMELRSAARSVALLLLLPIFAPAPILLCAFLLPHYFYSRCSRCAPAAIITLAAPSARCAFSRLLLRRRHHAPPPALFHYFHILFSSFSPLVIAIWYFLFLFFFAAIWNRLSAIFLFCLSPFRRRWSVFFFFFFFFFNSVFMPPLSTLCFPRHLFFDLWYTPEMTPFQLPLFFFLSSFLSPPPSYFLLFRYIFIFLPLFSFSHRCLLFIWRPSTLPRDAAARHVFHTLFILWYRCFSSSFFFLLHMDDIIIIFLFDIFKHFPLFCFSSYTQIFSRFLFRLLAAFFVFQDLRGRRGYRR